jgi:ankyrin repeat protein
MLTGIEQGLRTDALTLLRWLAYAKSPPNLGQLVDATVIDLTAEGTVKMEDRPGVDDTLEILSGLVTTEGVEGNYDDSYEIEDAHSKWSGSEDEIEPTSHRQQVRKYTRVRLAHFSVKEYLESKRILQGSAKDFHLESAREHRILSQSCLVYLLHYSSHNEKLSTEHDLATFPLLLYAAESWFYHAGLQQAADATHEARFLCGEDSLRDWLRVHQPDLSWRRPFSQLGDIGSSLYYASFVGLEAVVGELLKAGSDVNAQGGHYGNALQAASGGGHEKVVQVLMNAGADVNAQGGGYGNALQAASGGGHEKVVHMLMNAGADVNAQGGLYGNALQAASHQGHEKVVQVLMNAGADVNAQGGSYDDALQAASEGGYEKVVQMLMNAGADVNAQGRYFGNALQVASQQGHEKVVQILINVGADVNAQGGHYGNALQAASEGGYEKVVQMLINAGADVNAQGGYFGNALQAASEGGHEKVVQMLINVGANVNAQEGLYGNALQAASGGGHEKVVQMLVNEVVEPVLSFFI